jgi:hypothetical protein
VCKGVLFAAASLIISVFPAVAQPAAHPLSLQDCVRLAETVPSAAGLALQDREIADRQVVAARAGFLSQAGSASGYTYNSPLLDDRSAFSFVALNGLRGYVALFSVTQEVDTSLIALYIAGKTLNISSFMGAIMVVGIVHKNGIQMALRRKPWYWL